MACELGMEAYKHYYTTKYIRLPELLADLTVVRGEGKFKEIIRQYQKYTLFILDGNIVYLKNILQNSDKYQNNRIEKVKKTTTEII